MIRPDAYAVAIALSEPFVPLATEPRVDEDQARREVLEWLLAERGLTAAHEMIGDSALSDAAF